MARGASLTCLAVLRLLLGGVAWGPLLLDKGDREAHTRTHARVPEAWRGEREARGGGHSKNT